MEFNVTEEQVERLLRQEVGAYVNAVLSPNRVKEMARDMVKSAVMGDLSEVFSETVSTVVDEFLTEPVDINDGWDGRKHYDTFRDFFKARMREKLERSHEMRDEVSRVLKEKVDAVWKMYSDEVVAEVIARCEREA